VRFADDFVVGFEHREDAERFWTDLRDRLAEFSLELNAEKTRLIRFGRFAACNRAERGLGKPETFQFLGFTHICAKTKNGRFKLKRITDSKRMRAKLRSVKAELMRRRDLPIPDQGRWLASVLRGHFNYYAVPDNGEAISAVCRCTQAMVQNRPARSWRRIASLSQCAFRSQIIGHWLMALRRRSQRHRMTWARIGRLADRWLPPARILHPWPTVRFDATTQGRSPVR
jgi:RNA-directed DNA polymerase